MTYVSIPLELAQSAAALAACAAEQLAEPPGFIKPEGAPHHWSEPAAMIAKALANTIGLSVDAPRHASITVLTRYDGDGEVEEQALFPRTDVGRYSLAVISLLSTHPKHVPTAIEEARRIRAGELSPEMRDVLKQERGVIKPIELLDPDTIPNAPVPRPKQALQWAIDNFGAVAGDMMERATRVVEEAIEVAQAAAVPEEVVAHLLSHVYQRPVGDLDQEIGGLGLTLEILAENAGLSSEIETAREWRRVNALPKDWWQKKHAAKIVAGVANIAERVAAGANTIAGALPAAAAALAEETKQLVADAERKTLVGKVVAGAVKLADAASQFRDRSLDEPDSPTVETSVEIWMTFSFEAWHLWPGAPEEHAYLGVRHRHLFKVKAWLLVSHENRDVEFIAKGRQIQRWCNGQARRERQENETGLTAGVSSWSCERWANELVAAFNLTRAEVSEDGENGATATRVGPPKARPSPETTPEEQRSGQATMGASQ